MRDGVPIGTVPRGKDFTFKFRKGEWAETLLMETISRHDDLFPVRYGISRDDTLYTESGLDEVKEKNVTEMKRPDILVYRAEVLDQLNDNIRELLEEYNRSNANDRKEILESIEAFQLPQKAALAIEAEASVFNTDKREKKSSLSAYVKKEDYPRLANWKLRHRVPIVVCQLFFDRGYIIPFNTIEQHADAHTADRAFNEPGFVDGEIPSIFKPAYIIKLDQYKAAISLGRIETPPSIVKEIDGKLHHLSFSWNRGGRVNAFHNKEPINDPHFYGGEFENSTPDRFYNWTRK
jgi:hypothetical protein